MIMWFIYKI